MFSSFSLLSSIPLIIPPTIIGVLKWIGRYSPTAKGSTGIPNSSTTIPIPTPMNINAHGRLPLITPSITNFIKVACGAGNSCEPKPQALFNSINTKPIAKAEATAPIILHIVVSLE